MRVLHVCAELYPLLKTGGLADVAAALPPALAGLGTDTRVLLPGFPTILHGLSALSPVTVLPPIFGSRQPRLHVGRLPNGGVPVYVIEAPELYDRPGNPYVDRSNQAYPDNDRRFALLGWTGAQLASGLDPEWKPEVVHGHDWHAGLMPAYLRATQRRDGQATAKSVFTIHNLAYQGTFPFESFNEFGLPSDFFSMDGLEFYGQVSFMKSGLIYSDTLTTVSPTYAREIQEPPNGCGLDGLLRHRADDLHGILNGVDPAVWNPANDSLIAAPYTRDTLAGKHSCKKALQQETGLHVREEALLFGVVSRLTEQKGLHLVLEGLQELMARGGQLVVLGSGDPELEAAFHQAALANPGSVAVQLGYDEKQSHRIIAGSDVILVPSLFEPCGLTQLYGLLYGTLPLVRKTGGLADSVVDCTLENLDDSTATGFVFEAFNANAYNAAVRRAFALHRQPGAWANVQRTAMQQQFTWEKSAENYRTLYQQLIPG